MLNHKGTKGTKNKKGLVLSGESLTAIDSWVLTEKTNDLHFEKGHWRNEDRHGTSRPDWTSVLRLFSEATRVQKKSYGPKQSMSNGPHNYTPNARNEFAIRVPPLAFVSIYVKIHVTVEM